LQQQQGERASNPITITITLNITITITINTTITTPSSHTAATRRASA
jgi:hypothetical protein